jgi:hypothetical protein
MLRRLRIVDAMTCSACEIPRFVLAAFPARVITTVVAREAGVVHVRRLHSGEFLDMPFDSSSTCAWPGPWQVSQPCAAAGDRGCAT